jgi:hypothetical protein
MNKSVALVSVLVFLTGACIVITKPVRTDTTIYTKSFGLPSGSPPTPEITHYGFIFIRPNGNIEPSAAPIQRNGNTYTFTGNIYDPIVLERDNIVLDGAGYTLRGNETGTPIREIQPEPGRPRAWVGMDNGVGVNITAANVMVKNIHIDNWVAGILGAWDNNDIAANSITNCQYGMKIYGEFYNIFGNYIANSTEVGVLDAGEGQITNNNFTGNKLGLLLSQSKSVSVHVVVENDMSNSEGDIHVQCSGTLAIYHNNFFNSGPGTVSVSRLYHPLSGNPLPLDAALDHGYPSGGNYWRDYEGTDANGDGIGDTPYNLTIVGWDNISYQDRYPLMSPINITNVPSESTLLSPRPTPSPSPSPTSSPEPKQDSGIPTEYQIAAVTMSMVVIVTLATAVLKRKK